MLLSALSVIYISTPESKAQGEENLNNSYIVLRGSEDDTNGKKLGQSVVNGLIIVSVIGVMTFVIVLLYKYRCMKCLLGYMIFASAMLLGFLSSEMFMVAIDRYRLNIDKISFALLIFNFAAVGTFSIFFGKGATPPYIAQFYLIASSVIVAWHLSHFDPWTAWVLLILLALYDLFAVLTPCGPLKALVKLMQRDDAPEMPGLLYEASLPRARRNQNEESAAGTSNENSATDTASTSPVIQGRESTENATGRELEGNEEVSEQDGDAKTDLQSENVANMGSCSEATKQGNEKVAADNEKVAADNDSQSDVEQNGQVVTNTTGVTAPVEVTRTDDVEQPNEPVELPRGRVPLALALNDRLPVINPPRTIASVSQEENSWTPVELTQEVEVIFPRTGWRYEKHNVQRDEEETRYALLDPENNVKRVVFIDEQGRLFEDIRCRERVTGMIPLAVAKLNKLSFVEEPQPSWVRQRLADDRDEAGSAPEIEEYTVEQLRQEVHVVFPRNGWRIVKHSQQRENEETRYAIIKPDGSIKRIVFVNEEGRVFEDMREKNKAAAAEERTKERTSIKLGLGDFIFYSILVSKAALYSFTTFFACSLAIIVGLGLTLLMLAVRGKALPALPISIFLGVSFYLITRYSMEPWIQEVFIQVTYV